MQPPRLVYRRESQGHVVAPRTAPQAARGGLPPPVAPAPAAGLSKSHNRPLTHSRQSWQGASLLRLKAPAREQPEQEQKPREAIDEFSSRSRHRLRLFLATMLRDCLPFMLTLTYPGEFSTDDRAWKADLAAWCRRLKRAYPGVSAVWKLEFQKRGAPHFHLFLWGLQMDACWSEKVQQSRSAQMNASSYGDFRSWAERAWFEVVGSGDERHLRAGCNLQRIQKPGRLMNYVAGYVSKEDQSLPGQKVGRYWGCHNREALPAAEPVDNSMEYRDYVAVRRTARRFQRSVRMEAFRRARAAGRKMRKPQQRNNMSVAMVCDVDQWERALPKIVEGAKWWVERTKDVPRRTPTQL